jgi:ABC-type branched-subunit amino acid transport system ATPase component
MNGLEVENVSVRFGGLVAVDGVSLTAPGGRITGLIGPNGAGKTTTFNACSGLVATASGRVRLGGEDVTRFGPAERARRGLGRTFQRMELFDSMTVEENVSLGCEARLAAAALSRQVVATRKERAATAVAADEAITRCGLTTIARRRTGALSAGQRRLVELARAHAGRFDLLLLDEPSSGLDTEETEHLGRVVRDMVAERGCGILLVEHDMDLVMSISDYLYVLDFGRLIFEGTPEATRRSPIVRSAYLGEEDGLAELAPARAAGERA